MIDAAAGVMRAARACADASVWPLPDAGLIATLDTIHRAERLLAAAKLTVVREVDGRGLARVQGASSTAVWMRDRLRIPAAEARRLVADAAWLDADDPTGGLGPDGARDDHAGPQDDADGRAGPAAGLASGGPGGEHAGPEDGPDGRARPALGLASGGPGGEHAGPEDGPDGRASSAIGDGPGRCGAADGTDAASAASAADPASRWVDDRHTGSDADPPVDRGALGCGRAAAGSVLRAAVIAGAVSLEQARIVAVAVEGARREAGAVVAGKALRMLLAQAAELEPRALRMCADRILWHVAPQAAEEADRRALRRLERELDRRRDLTVSVGPDGGVRLRGTLDAETGGMLIAALDPLTGPNGPGDDRSPGQRRHDALGEALRLSLRCGSLPDNGGEPPQVVITTRIDALTGRLGAGILDTGARLSAETVRRWACDAAILPAVLDGAGQVLDVGRARRLFTGSLRRALVLRDRGCAFPGCDRPPRWCDGHHLRSWADGGATALTNAVLLCRYHHRVIHQGHWQARLAPDGLPEFLPPAWIDPRQLPRRNHSHLRC
ncbi:DUF222 domain-containing protein [Plantactinospora siamensis]|uniref:DUF222 domain-containing protein n=1 Tax=Plantactinospora siamensis TaxID=555372 RepID=A0ABV6NSC0_9ACTN